MAEKTIKLIGPQPGTKIAAEAILLMVGAGIYIGASRHHAAQRLEPRYA